MQSEKQEKLEFEASENLIDYVKSLTDTVILLFSRGKDSIGTWLAVRDHFNVIPVYQYYIPSLSFIDESLRYYEKAFGAKIHQVPHTRFLESLYACEYQTKERCDKLMKHGVNVWSFRRDLCRQFAEEQGHKDAFAALGLRMDDSNMRRMIIKKNGVISFKRMEFLPIFDWSKARLIEEIKASGIKLPVDYKMFDRSYEFPKYASLRHIRKHYPQDYETILQWYPLIEAEMMRYEESH